MGHALIVIYPSEASLSEEGLAKQSSGEVGVTSTRRRT